MNAGETGWQLIIPCNTNIDLTQVTSVELVTLAPDGTTKADYPAAIGTSATVVKGITYAANSYCYVNVATGMFTQAGRYQVQLRTIDQTGDVRLATIGFVVIGPSLVA